MAIYLYYILSGIYGVILLAALIYYLSRKAPAGDASVAWAMGIFQLAGLALIFAAALLLRRVPGAGLGVLSIPLVWLALPGIRKTLREGYAWFPGLGRITPVTIHIENGSEAMWHVKLECWFGSRKGSSARLFTTFDYYPEPLQKASYSLTVYQTRLLTQKSAFVGISIFERVKESGDGFEYIREIQPCLRYYEESPEAFRQAHYTVKTNL